MTAVRIVLAVLAAWTVLSIPAAVLVGRAIAGHGCPGGCK